MPRGTSRPPLTTSIALIVLAYLLIFPAFLVLRHTARDLHRPFRLPGGTVGAWLATLAATAWSLLAAVCLLWPGFGTGDPDHHLPAAFHDQRLRFELVIVTPVLVVIAAAAGYAAFERLRTGPTRRHQ